MEGNVHRRAFDREASCPAGSPVPVPGLTARAASELSHQLDAVIAFADYCAFLTEGRLAATAEQLVDLAHQIYDAAAQMDAPRDRH